jgi:hypothetical protein
LRHENKKGHNSVPTFRDNVSVPYSRAIKSEKKSRIFADVVRPKFMNVTVCNKSFLLRKDQKHGGGAKYFGSPAGTGKLCTELNLKYTVV